MRVVNEYLQFKIKIIYKYDDGSRDELKKGLNRI